jgi:glycine cleavage system H protein
MLSSATFRSFAKLYTKTHEWVELIGSIGTMGITQYNADRLGEILFAGVLPGHQVSRGEEFGDVESMSALIHVRAPVAGTVIDVNPRLRDNPELINSSPETEGWIAKIQISDPLMTSDLLDGPSYTNFIQK